jgi:heme/copper-type cytochrome/quinol oxidase subunit 2
VQIESIDRGLTLAMGILVSATTLVWLLRHGRCPATPSGLRRLEMIWTIVPIVLLMTLFVATYLPKSNG